MRRMLALALLLTLAPAALADGTEEKPACPDGSVASPEGCSQQAWVDDCPPDMMCAMGNQTQGNGTMPHECGFDTCGAPIQYGPDGCIECSGPIDDGLRDPPATCMDGADAGEDCQDGVQYLDGGGPARGPADGSCEFCRGAENAPAGSRDAAGIGAAALLGAAALALALLRRR